MVDHGLSVGADSYSAFTACKGLARRLECRMEPDHAMSAGVAQRLCEKELRGDALEHEPGIVRKAETRIERRVADQHDAAGIFSDGEIESAWAARRARMMNCSV